MLEYFNGQGISTYNNSLQYDGQLIHGVNVVGFPFGGYSKRPGYNAFLGTPDNAQVNSLLSFPNQDGTTLWLYRASGSSLYYSQQGTGAWTLAGNGTINNGQHFGYAVLNNTLIGGDGLGSTRHTTNGTSFTNTSLAPIGQHYAQFHGRIYTTSGTTSILAYSTANDPTNWNTGGTSDSSSLTVPDEGAAAKIFNAGDRLIITKSKGKMFNWDDYSLIDMTTRYGPSSPWSVANIDNAWFYANNFGIFHFDGANKELISNPIQRQFYNRNNTGIGTASWGTMPAEAHIWDYFLAAGTLTDDFTGRQINNAIIKYDYQKNQFLNWQFANAPTALHSYIDATNQKQLIFGDASGQCYQLDLTASSDNGASIPTEVVFLFTYAQQAQSFNPNVAPTTFGSSFEKKWNWIRLFFNPGDECNIQFAFSNTLTYQHLRWSTAIDTSQRTGDYHQVSDGVCEIRFPRDENNMPRSRFMFLRIYDDSDSSRWSYYGAEVSAEPIVKE